MTAETPASRGKPDRRADGDRIDDLQLVKPALHLNYSRVRSPLPELKLPGYLLEADLPNRAQVLKIEARRISVLMKHYADMLKICCA